MKISAAAKLFGIPEPTLRSAILAGKVPATVDEVTGVQVVKPEDVQAWKDDEKQHVPGRKASN